jgi:hypothetical protein
LTHVNTWLLKQVHQLVAEDVVVEAVVTVAETVVTVQTVVIAQTVVTEVIEAATVEDSEAVDVEATVDVVVTAPSSEADAVVHAAEPMFLKSTTPRRSPAWAHSMLTPHAHDHLIWYSNKDYFTIRISFEWQQNGTVCLRWQAVKWRGLPIGPLEL